MYPGLGVAFEVRPRMLAASSPRRRLEVASRGIDQSIAHLEAINKSFLRRTLRGIFRAVSPQTFLALFGVLVASLCTLLKPVAPAGEQGQTEWSGRRCGI